MPDSSNTQPLDWRSFEIEPIGAGTGHCDCCGTTTQRIWGLISCDDAAVASYFVAWTQQHPDHGAAIDLVLGTWGDSVTKQDRYLVALAFRVVDDSGQFMVVDAQKRLAFFEDVASTALERSDVIGTPLAAQVFALIDAIWMGDPRLDEVRNWK